MAAPTSSWSTLIIRVWRSEADGDGLRARLTELDDFESPGRRVAAAGDVEAVLDATRAWLVRATAGGH